jgi:hypothetical protein
MRPYLIIAKLMRPSNVKRFPTPGLDHAMAQVVSRRLLTAESWVYAQVSPCMICGGHSGTGTVLSSLVFPCQYHSTVSLHTHIYIYIYICIIWGMNNRFGGRRSET